MRTRLAAALLGSVAVLLVAQRVVQELPGPDSASRPVEGATATPPVAAFVDGVPVYEHEVDGYATELISGVMAVQAGQYDPRSGFGWDPEPSPAQAPQSGPTPMSVSAACEVALAELIDQRVVELVALRMGITVTESELDRAVEGAMDARLRDASYKSMLSDVMSAHEWTEGDMLDNLRRAYRYHAMEERLRQKLAEGAPTPDATQIAEQAQPSVSEHYISLIPMFYDTITETRTAYSEALTWDRAGGGVAITNAISRAVETGGLPPNYGDQWYLTYTWTRLADLPDHVVGALQSSDGRFSQWHRPAGETGGVVNFVLSNSIETYGLPVPESTEDYWTPIAVGWTSEDEAAELAQEQLARNYVSDSLQAIRAQADITIIKDCTP
jgi:hypothetical protein